MKLESELRFKEINSNLNLAEQNLQTGSKIMEETAMQQRLAAEAKISNLEVQIKGLFDKINVLGQTLDQNFEEFNAKINIEKNKQLDNLQ